MAQLVWPIINILSCMSLLSTVICRIPAACQQCLDSSKCLPPDCFCCRDELSLPNIARSQIPQMVFFTFDDAVTEQVSGFYFQLFHETRKNPNSCPISMTLFISHDNTKYRLVSEFYRKGMEIASHSVTHNTMNGTNFYQEAKAQKENLAKLAGIPVNEITGWRSPFLKPTGDLQPDVLKKLGYTYDATLTFSKRSFREKPPGPFTLDFGYPYECQVKPCPKHKHPGFWEVPVVSLLDYKQAYDCVYVDGCMNAPPDEDAAYQFLWDNFHNYYTTTKMPFGINMHPSWFYYPDRLKAMDRFIQKLVSLNDVYIVSANKMLEWLKRPTPLQDLHSFEPWACDGKEKAFQTGPRLVKFNLHPPLSPRAFISWTNSPAITNNTRAPSVRRRMLTKTRLFTPAIYSNESTRFIHAKPRKHLFTLDLSNSRRRQQKQPLQNARWAQRTIAPNPTSRRPIFRLRQRRPNQPQQLKSTLSQHERLDQHEEIMRRRRILEEQKRQKEILERRQRQQRHQELLVQQRQQELADKQRQGVFRQQNDVRGQQRVLWKPSSLSSSSNQGAANPPNNRRTWKPRIHQETVKLWPHIGQSFSVPQNRITERPRQVRGRNRDRFDSRPVLPTVRSSTQSRFIEVTPAPIPAPARHVNRFTESPRHMWYTDMRTRFGPITNGPRFSRGGSNRRPGTLDTTAGPRVSASPQRQRRIQAQQIGSPTNTINWQREREERIRQQQSRERRGRRTNTNLATRVSNDLNMDRPSFPIRERNANNSPGPTRGMYSRNALHPTVAQQLAWNSFIRQMLGPH